MLNKFYSTSFFSEVMILKNFEKCFHCIYYRLVNLAVCLHYGSAEIATKSIIAVDQPSKLIQ